MKKTLIALMALGSVAMANVVVTETHEMTGQSLTLPGYKMYEDWTMVIDYKVNEFALDKSQYNRYLVGSYGETELFRVEFNKSNANIMAGGSSAQPALKGVWDGTVTMAYTAADNTLSYDLNGTTGSFTLNAAFGDYAHLNKITTSVTDTHVANDVQARPSVTITAAIPEPATASLSLLALAGLAARRRRK